VDAAHSILEGKVDEVVNASPLDKFIFNIILDRSSFADTMKCMGKMGDNGPDVMYIIRLDR
jgi:hypothetical protein